MPVRYGLWMFAGVSMIALAAPVGAEDQLKKEHERFITEEAVVLITPPEQAVWDQLGSHQQREAFIVDFWARRDPTPESPENEFKRGWLERVEEARKRARGERGPGPATDRGRVLLAFGPPDGVQEVRAPSGPGAQPQRPASSGRIGEDEDRQVDFGATSGVQDLRPVEIRWRYRELLPEMGGQTEIVFQRDPLGNYRLATPGLDLSQAATYRLNGLDPTRIPAPGGAAAAAPPAAAPEPSVPPVPAFTGDPKQDAMLDRLLSGAEKRTDIGIQIEPFYFPSQQDSTFVALAFSLEESTLPWSPTDAGGRAELFLFGAVLQGTGPSIAKFHDFTYPLSVQPSGSESAAAASGAGPTYSIGVPLLPGIYTLLLGIRTADGVRASTQRLELTVPDFDELALSIPTALFLEGMLERLEQVPPLEQVHTGLVVGSGRLPLRLDRRLSKATDQAVLFFLVAGAEPDPETGTPALRVEYRLRKPDGSTVRLAPQTLPQNSVAQPLPLANREPGDYTITIAVVDTLAGNNRVERQEEFTVVP